MHLTRSDDWSVSQGGRQTTHAASPAPQAFGCMEASYRNPYMAASTNAYRAPEPSRFPPNPVVVPFMSDKKIQIPSWTNQKDGGDTQAVYTCDQCLTTCKREKDLQRHRNAKHMESKTIFICTQPSCSWSESRNDKKMMHVRKTGHACEEVSNPNYRVPSAALPRRDVADGS